MSSVSARVVSRRRGGLGSGWKGHPPQELVRTGSQACSYFIAHKGLMSRLGGVSRTGCLGLPSSLPALTSPQPAVSQAVYFGLATGRPEEED